MTMNSSPCRDFEYPYDAFRIGTTVTGFEPGKEVYRHMLRLIAYDIANPSRLRKVSIACKDFGIRVEYSVFECDLSEELFDMFWARLSGIIDHDEDRVLAYRICGSCVSSISSMGTIVRPGKPLLYIL